MFPLVADMLQPLYAQSWCPPVFSSIWKKHAVWGDEQGEILCIQNNKTWFKEVNQFKKTKKDTVILEKLKLDHETYCRRVFEDAEKERKKKLTLTQSS